MKKAIFTMVIAATVLTSCQKQPEADFTTDKTEYIGGESVMLDSKSLDAYSMEWTLPDGQTSKSKSVEFITDEDSDDGNLTFKLEAFSKNGKKSDETSKTVTIKAAKGNVVFWQTGGKYDVTQVTINGTSQSITKDVNSADCETIGCAIFKDLKVGIYNFTATDGDYNWSGSVTISKDKCTVQKLS